MKRSDIAAYGVFCGIDVGKTGHYMVVLDHDGDKPLLSGSVAQDEAAIREALTKAGDIEGRMLVTVDQYGSFGSLTVAVAKDMGLDVAHLSPRKFKQVAEIYGEDKTDAKDAFIIADASRSMPRHIELVGERPEIMAEIKVLTSCRDDTVRERTRCYNRLHDLLHRACPALDKVLSKQKLHNGLEICLVEHYGGPQGLKRAGKTRVAKWAGSLKYCKTRGPKLAETVFEALSKQTVTLPATTVIEAQAKKVAKRIIELEVEEKELDAELERLSEQMVEVEILRSIPGVGRVFGATIAAEIGDINRFADAHHLASYAGVAPVKKESSTIKKSRKRKGGNRRLKNVFVQSAVIAAFREGSAEETYYKKKIAEGKTHQQACLALARRRVEVVYAMLTNGTYYEPLSVAA